MKLSTMKILLFLNCIVVLLNFGQTLDCGNPDPSEYCVSKTYTKDKLPPNPPLNISMSLSISVRTIYIPWKDDLRSTVENKLPSFVDTGFICIYFPFYRKWVELMMQHFLSQSDLPFMYFGMTQELFAWRMAISTFNWGLQPFKNISFQIFISIIYWTSSNLNLLILWKPYF